MTCSSNSRIQLNLNPCIMCECLFVCACGCVWVSVIVDCGSVLLCLCVFVLAYLSVLVSALVLILSESVCVTVRVCVCVCVSFTLFCLSVIMKVGVASSCIMFAYLGVCSQLLRLAIALHLPMKFGRHLGLSCHVYWRIVDGDHVEARCPKSQNCRHLVYQTVFPAHAWIRWN
jgi:hypothetical protein